MKKTRIFQDCESGEIITLEQLKKEFKELKDAGETEAETFSDYLKNCTDKNGTLTEL